MMIITSVWTACPSRASRSPTASAAAPPRSTSSKIRLRGSFDDSRTTFNANKNRASSLIVLSIGPGAMPLLVLASNLTVLVRSVPLRLVKLANHCFKTCSIKRRTFSSTAASNALRHLCAHCRYCSQCLITILPLCGGVLWCASLPDYLQYWQGRQVFGASAANHQYCSYVFWLVDATCNQSSSCSNCRGLTSKLLLVACMRLLTANSASTLQYCYGFI